MEELDLSNNQITDLTQLESLVNLKKYTLDGNPISEEQVEDFGKKLFKNQFLFEYSQNYKWPTADAVEILKYVAEITDGSDAWFSPLIAGGCDVTIADAVEVLKKVAGLPSDKLDFWRD